MLSLNSVTRQLYHTAEVGVEAHLQEL
jgi:hypothetical protein